MRSIEKLFQEAYKDYTQKPSSSVLKGLRRRLWLSDYLSLNFKKFNITYTFIIAGLIGSFFWIGFNNSNPDLSLTTNTSNNNLNNHKTIKPNKQDNSELTSETKANEPLESIYDGMEDEKTSAFFDASATFGCTPFTVSFSLIEKKSLNYHWDFGDGAKSNTPVTNYTYKKSGEYIATLTAINENGVSTSYSRKIVVHNSPKAEFEIDPENSDNLNKAVAFINKSIGANKYLWDFGDKTQSDENTALHQYNDFGVYYVKLIAKDENGCSDTAFVTNKYIEQNYNLAFPLNFRPNTSGSVNTNNLKDASVFTPKNLGAKEYNLAVFTPNGTKIFSTKDIKLGWNGYIRGRLAPSGIYNYRAKGIYPNGEKFDIKGKVKVIVEDYNLNY